MQAPRDLIGCGFIDVSWLAHGVIQTPIVVQRKVWARHAAPHREDAVSGPNVDLVDAFWTQSRRVHAAVFEHSERVPCHGLTGVGACTARLKSEVACDGLGQLGPAGVADTDEEEVHGANGWPPCLNVVVIRSGSARRLGPKRWLKVSPPTLGAMWTYLKPVALSLLMWLALFAGHIAAAAQGMWVLFEVLSWSLGAVGLALGGLAVSLNARFGEASDGPRVLAVGQGVALVLSASFGWARDGVGLEMVAWPALSVLLWWLMHRRMTVASNP